MAEMEGFEPPGGVTLQLISSQPRYDHFDTSPYFLIRDNFCGEITMISSQPRYVLLRCPKKPSGLRFSSAYFDRGHSLSSLFLPQAALASLPTSIHLRITQSLYPMESEKSSSIKSEGFI